MARARKTRPQACLVAFADEAAPAGRLAAELGLPLLSAEAHVFPDSERRVRITGAAAETLLYRSLNDPEARDPDDRLIEVLLAASALRAQGARWLTLVAPYLCYMRQDVAFRRGEAVSQKVVGQLLGATFGRVVAVAPHLHRTRRLAAVVAPAEGLAISAAPAFAALLRAEGVTKETVVLGPDAESKAEVKALAEALGLVWLTAEKRRAGDREVAITIPAKALLKGRPVVIYDDVVATGTTLMQCALMALEAGAASVEALAVHALFGKAEEAAFAAAGIRRLRSSDSLRHPSNGVFLAPVIAEALRARIGPRRGR